MIALHSGEQRRRHVWAGRAIEVANAVTKAGQRSVPPSGPTEEGNPCENDACASRPIATFSCHGRTRTALTLRAAGSRHIGAAGLCESHQHDVSDAARVRDARGRARASAGVPGHRRRQRRRVLSRHPRCGDEGLRGEREYVAGLMRGRRATPSRWTVRVPFVFPRSSGQLTPAAAADYETGAFTNSGFGDVTGRRDPGRHQPRAPTGDHERLRRRFYGGSRGRSYRPRPRWSG